MVKLFIRQIYNTFAFIVIHKSNISKRAMRRCRNTFDFAKLCWFIFVAFLLDVSVCCILPGVPSYVVCMHHIRKKGHHHQHLNIICTKKTCSCACHDNQFKSTAKGLYILVKRFIAGIRIGWCIYNTYRLKQTRWFGI